MALMSAFTTTVTKNAVTSMKRISCPVKKLANGTCKFLSEVPEVNCVKKVAPTNGGSKVDTGENKLKSTLGPKQMIRGCPLSKQLPKLNCLGKPSVPNNQITTAICNKELKQVAGCKLKSEEVLESHERKKQKMDAATTLICHNILTDIMDLEHSGPFHIAAKPPTRGLVDYFDIAKKAKDLGTIKQKLLQDKYLFADEFEADVRRTFTTAMLFNPPGNHHHKSAKELLGTFDRLWEPVKMRKGCEESTKPSVERQKNYLKTIKDGKPTHKPKAMPGDPISLKTKSDSSGTESQSALPMPTAKVKCENVPKRKIAHVDIDAVKVNKTSTLQRGSYDQGYDSIARIPTSGSLGDTVIGVGICQSTDSPLRVARLLDRFSGTILKAQNYILQEQGGGTGAKALQKEAAKLQLWQHEEKRRAEPKVEAAKSAAPLKSKAELKKQREAEREASRKALDLVEKSVIVEDNWKVLKDFEAMIGQPLVDMCPGDRSRANSAWSRMHNNELKSPLKQLGLHMKEEYKLGNENDNINSTDGEWEEGEIIC